jgi:hypothetical protein
MLLTAKYRSTIGLSVLGIFISSAVALYLHDIYKGATNNCFKLNYSGINTKAVLRAKKATAAITIQLNGSPIKQTLPWWARRIPLTTGSGFLCENNHTFVRLFEQKSI